MLETVTGTEDTKVNKIWFVFLKGSLRIRKKIYSQAPMAHICNPGYSGGRDQED
jgi:hypothetical protein